MPRSPIVVIADDLTGAAEIAGIGLRHGLTANVITDFRQPAQSADLLIFDTDSRLDSNEVAHEKIRALGILFADLPRELLYKKIDSVLRGPVRTELEALAHTLDQTRVLLVPANPTLGRTVQKGRYAINGEPLHNTAFARDPHHPARTSAVSERLGSSGSFPVSVGTPQAPLASAGIIVGDAASPQDIDDWARVATATPDLLLAGAAEFFSALLHERGFRPQPESAPIGIAKPILVISGTTSPAGRALREDAQRAGIPILPMPAKATREPAIAAVAIQEWAHAVQAQLDSSGHAIALFDGPVVAVTIDALAVAIRRTFAELARELIDHRVSVHLIVEGGATAAAVTRMLGCHELPVTHEWAPGVVSLRTGVNGITLTLKPGSYAWPTALWRAVIAAGTKSFHA